MPRLQHVIKLFPFHLKLSKKKPTTCIQTIIHRWKEGWREGHGRRKAGLMVKPVLFPLCSSVGQRRQDGSTIGKHHPRIPAPSRGFFPNQQRKKINRHSACSRWQLVVVSDLERGLQATGSVPLPALCFEVLRSFQIRGWGGSGKHLLLSAK